MRRLDAAASLALPPISSLEVFSDGEGWTVTERRPPVVSRQKPPPKVSSPSPRRRAASVQKSSSNPHWEKAYGDVPPQSARKPRSHDAPEKLSSVVAVAKEVSPNSGATQDDLQQPVSTDGGDAEDVAENGAKAGVTGPVNLSTAYAPGHQPTVGPTMKGKTITNWLNHTLGQATNKPESGAVASAAAKQAQGLAQFGIDSAALERLGLDQQAADRVYRAMFVYSQGLHAVLQEAVGRAKNSSTALLVLWRAFQSVLEQAGQSDEHGNETLADLVKRGNEEEKDRIEGQFKDQIANVQAQVEKLGRERRTLQEELQRVKEDEMRLRNESEMYRSEHETTEKKYEQQLKLRGEAEVKYLDKVRHCEALQESLDREIDKGTDLKMQLKEEISTNMQARQELESMTAHNKVLDGQVQMLRQQVQEGLIYKQRMEQQVSLLKQQMDRTGAQTSELQDLLDVEQEANKRISEQLAAQQREMRALEREYEDEQHVRKELTNERALLREKVDRMDRDMNELVDERRTLQKQLNDLNLEHRTTQIELKRKVDSLERAERSLEHVQASHRELTESHRALSVEAENLRQDVASLESQVEKEAELRKSLQTERKALASQSKSLEVQLETSQLAVSSCQRELTEVTESKVKLESIVRDVKSSMQKVTLEQQVELKSHAQKVSMLEKVITDERAERRNLVYETQEVTMKRDECLEQLRQANIEIGNLRRQRLDREEEADRLKVLLRAQEQRNSEQLVTVDKYHATVAAHEAETRQIQVLLECERQEAARQHAELQDSFAAAKKSLEQRVDQWKLSYEDLYSRLAFNEASMKIKPLEDQIVKLKEKVLQSELELEDEKERTRSELEAAKKKDARIASLSEQTVKLEAERDECQERLLEVLPELEKKSMECEDAIHHLVRLRQSTEVFEEVKSSLEAELETSKLEVERLVISMERSQVDASTQVYIDTTVSNVQTDLSYQYLESADHMQGGDRWRRDRLENLRRASHFVEDPEMRRDFTVMQSTAPARAAVAHDVSPSTSNPFLASPDLQSESSTSRAAGPMDARMASSMPVPVARHVELPLEKNALVTTLPSTKKSLKTGGPAVPDPWPTARPPGAPPAGSNKIQAMRKTLPAQNALHAAPGGIHISQVKTTAKAGLPPFAELQRMQQPRSQSFTPSPWETN